MSTATQTVAHATRAGRGAIAVAVIGNWLEFFDFTVYGFFAVIIGKLYFPSADSTNSLLLSVGTFRLGAENHGQAEEIKALAWRVRELQARLDASATASLRPTRFHAPDSPGACRRLTAPAPSGQHRQKAQQ